MKYSDEKCDVYNSCKKYTASAELEVQSSCKENHQMIDDNMFSVTYYSFSSGWLAFDIFAKHIH